MESSLSLLDEEPLRHVRSPGSLMKLAHAAGSPRLGSLHWSRHGTHGTHGSQIPCCSHGLVSLSALRTSHGFP